VAALQRLAKRQAHVAGAHLVDARSGTWNVADVRRHAGREPVTLITLGAWEAGLVIARGNPKGVRSSDVGRRRLRWVVREVGAGARRLFDRVLRDSGVEGPVTGTTIEAGGHLEVAQLVAAGAADAGVATRDAAIAYDLDFLPLAEERYDLVVPLAWMDDPRARRLFDALVDGAFRRELDFLGYDVSDCGTQAAAIGEA
jgi:molybdate-binding protein